MKDISLVMPLEESFRRRVEERFNTQKFGGFGFRGLRFKGLESVLLGVILVLVWFTLPKILRHFDGTVGMVDQSIWMLVLLAMLSFLLVVGMSWYILVWGWRALGLPGVRVMVFFAGFATGARLKLLRSGIKYRNHRA